MADDTRHLAPQPYRHRRIDVQPASRAKFPPPPAFPPPPRPGPAKVGSPDTVPSPDQAHLKALARARKKFEKLDVDGNGVLQGTELTALSQWLWSSFHPDGEQLTADQIQTETDKLMKRLDANGDGSMDFDEFSDWFHRTCENVTRFRKGRAQGSQRSPSKSKTTTPLPPSPPPTSTPSKSKATPPLPPTPPPARTPSMADEVSRRLQKDAPDEQHNGGQTEWGSFLSQLQASVKLAVTQQPPEGDESDESDETDEEEYQQRCEELRLEVQKQARAEALIQAIYEQNNKLPDSPNNLPESSPAQPSAPPAVPAAAPSSTSPSTPAVPKLRGSPSGSPSWAREWGNYKTPESSPRPEHTATEFDTPHSQPPPSAPSGEHDASKAEGEGAAGKVEGAPSPHADCNWEKCSGWNCAFEKKNKPAPVVVEREPVPEPVPYMSRPYGVSDPASESSIYVMDRDQLEEMILAAIDEECDSFEAPSQSAMCRVMQKFGMRLRLDTTTMKKLFGVVKNHSYTALQSAPVLQSEMFLDKSEAAPNLKRSQIDSREEFAEDVAEALHSPEELARVQGQPPPAPSRAQKKRCKALFKIIDVNSDGNLSADEIAESFPTEWIERKLDRMLIEQSTETGVHMESWVGFTRDLVRTYGSAFVNSFLSTMLSKYLGGLNDEEKHAGLLAFGAMDADMSGTLDCDEIHEVFDAHFPEYLTERPQSLVRVEKGCIDAHMWLLFLREVKHFEGEEVLESLLQKITHFAFEYDIKKAKIFNDLTGPLFASAIAYFA